MQQLSDLPVSGMCKILVYDIKLEILRRLYCDLGLLHEDCPINGGWTSWTPWGSCVGRCGQVGLRWRTRKCNNPSPANNGAICSGNYHESKECRLKGCTLEDYKNLVKCDLVKSKELEYIESVHIRDPALTTRCLETECQYNTVNKILKEETDLYWNALHCVKHNIGCSEFGGWSNWGEWSDCSSRCGNGKQIRCRSCDSPRPSNYLYKCLGSNCSTTPCIGSKCNITKDGKWSGWSEWSVCSATCGQGLTKRVRNCINNEILSNPKPNTPDCRDYHVRRIKKANENKLVGSHLCTGPFEEINPCFNKECPMDGGWSEWEPWSQCSAGCGLGMQSRSRACSCPPTSEDGLRCIGPFTHIRHCFLRTCQAVPHELAVFLGDGSLSYYKTGIPIRLLHLYIKFRTSDDSGDLIRRDCLSQTKNTYQYVRLFLEAGFIVLSVRMSKCFLTIISEQKVDHDKWTEVMIMLTPSGAVMRIDNGLMYYKAKFNCILKNPDFDSEMIVGYNFRGEIEKLAVNFKKRNLQNEKNEGSSPYESNTSPFLINNVEFHEGERDEGLISLENLIHAPCPKNMKSWSNTEINNYTSLKEVCSMTGTLAYLKIDDEIIDIENLPSINEHGTHPFSSEIVSYSNNYSEYELPYGEQLNLSCLYYLDLSNSDMLPRMQWNRSKPFWLKFDTPIDLNNNDPRFIQYEVTDNNRMSQLQTTYYNSREDIESFYSCWLPNPKKSNDSNILFTYGITVILPSLEFEGPVMTSVKVIYVIFQLLFGMLLLWLLYEYNQYSYKGWGIFTYDYTKRLRNDEKFILLHSSE